MQNGTEISVAAILILRQSFGGGGGADTVISGQIGFLDPARFKPLVVYLRKYGGSPGTIAQQFRKPGVTFIDLPGIRFFDPLQLAKLIWMIKKHKVRLIHCNDPKSDFLGALVKKLFPKIALVSTLHGWIENSPKGSFYASIDKIVLKKFDAVIAVSEEIASIARTHGIGGVRVIKNAVDLDYWVRREDKSVVSSPDTPFRVGYVGRLSHEKGPDLFVALAHAVIKAVDNTGTAVKFYMAGTGHEETAIKTLVREFRIEGSLRFLGHADKGRLRGLYERLDVLVLPSRTEGTPMAVLEAMAMGVPVVATNVGGVGGIITHGHDGLLVDVGDVDGLAAAILKLKDDAALRATLAKNARETVVSGYSLRNSVAALEKIYSDTIS